MSEIDDSTLFTDAMRLVPVSSENSDESVCAVSIFQGVINQHWTIGLKVHGGAMLALCANAALMSFGDSAGDVQPIAVTGNFLWAPRPRPDASGGHRAQTGPPRQPGRRRAAPGARTGDERSREEQRTAVRASVTLGDPEHHVPPLLSFNPVVPLMTPEPPPGLEPIGPGHPMADVVHLAHGCDIRPALHTLGPRSDGGPPVFEYWVRPKGVAPDVLFALSPSCAGGPSVATCRLR
jgi:acyl-CoA thioesterase superfamily protein